MKNLRVLGLDLAAVNSGACAIEVQSSLEYEVLYEEALTHPRDDFRNRAAAAESILSAATTHKVDFVVIEDYAFRVGPSNTSAYQHGEMGGMARQVLHDAGFDILVIPITSMRSFMSVPPKSKKDYLMEQAKNKMGFESSGRTKAHRGNITDAFIHAYTGSCWHFANEETLDTTVLDAAQHRMIYGDGKKFAGLTEREGLWYDGKEN